ncbi:hypothetical protein [Sporosarcina psychrophila]|uniref:Asp-tRNA(Asn)/Glu-tRNA(Gln) amidotransferase C subunit n=1 Tax=Sporosarcina psychrophila TaxID=1476 RepID=A0ABV2KB16_SPOPS
MTSLTDDRKNQNEKLIKMLNQLQGATVSGVEPSVKNTIAEGFFALLDELPFDLLPYAAVSQFVYSDDSEDFLYFIECLEEMITDKYDTTEVNYKKGIKMIEHMELAKQQKDHLFEEHDSEIKKINRLTNVFMARSSEIGKLQKATEKLREDTEELQEDNKRIMTNYISILGIFAAMLMGSFGSIQAFSNLFSNAHKLDLGIILIISSIGASSVILILFFLLNGIAKLTDRSLWSTKKETGTLIEKHPSLVIVHGILIFISLIGASLQLSNIHLNWAPKEGAWWLLPFIYLLIAWFFYRNFKWEWFQKIKRILIREKNT